MLDQFHEQNKARKHTRIMFAVIPNEESQFWVENDDFKEFSMVTQSDDL